MTLECFSKVVFMCSYFRMFEIICSIPKSELEEGYNHLNHSRALHYLELARLEYLKHIGCPNDDYIERKIFLVIASISIQYKREIFEGTIRATVENVRADGKALLMDQQIFNDRGKVCITSTFDTRFVDGSTKRSISIPDDFLKAAGIICM